jgi:small nuclear ribonucleoprotein (snRNP)-like protein
MEQSKIVVRLKDGTVVKGKTNDFFPNKPQFHLTTAEGFIDEYHVEKLKAIFFVKDYDGDESYSYSYNDEITGGGRKVRVSFADGEEIVGYTQGYSPNRSGFFITPGDLGGNNEKVFVVVSATTEVQFI